MKMLIAITLVVVAMVSAEAPNRGGIFQRQTAAPYQPRGWRPSGQSFNPTSNFQRQELAPEPVPSYGPPPPSASYGPPSDATTTEVPTTTEAFTEAVTEPFDLQGENLKAELLKADQKAEKLQNQPEQQLGQVYVVLPQSQNYIYTTAVRPLSAALVQPSEPKNEVELIKEPKLAPVQAVPALAKIQAARIQAPVVFAKYEQVPQLLQFQQIQAVPYVRYPASSYSQSAVHSPYSESYVQVFQ